MKDYEEEAAFSVGEEIVQAASVLQSHGIEHADFEAISLFAAITSVGTAQVRQWAIMEKKLWQISEEPEAIHTSYMDVLARRSQHEPLQYIVGSVGFRFLDLAVGPGVFVPRPETEMVVQYGIDWLNHQFIATSPSQQVHPSINVVDLCAGSGAIGLSIANEISGAKVRAVEISPQAFSWLKKNENKTRQNNAGLDYEALLGDATSPSILSDCNGKVDCVITNPPYIPQNSPVKQHEAACDPEMALYGGSADGMAIPQRVITTAARLLHRGGLLVVEHDISQVQAMRETFIDRGFGDVEIHNDLTDRPRFTTGIRNP